MWIVGFVFTMITGGNDTMTGLLGGAAELLTDHRDQRQTLIEEPDLIGPADRRTPPPHLTGAEPGPHHHPTGRASTARPSPRASR